MFASTNSSPPPHPPLTVSGPKSSLIIYNTNENEKKEEDFEEVLTDPVLLQFERLLTFMKGHTLPRPKFLISQLVSLRLLPSAFSGDLGKFFAFSKQREQRFKTELETVSMNNYSNEHDVDVDLNDSGDYNDEALSSDSDVANSDNEDCNDGAANKALPLELIELKKKKVQIKKIRRNLRRRQKAEVFEHTRSQPLTLLSKVLESKSLSLDNSDPTAITLSYNSPFPAVVDIWSLLSLLNKSPWEGPCGGVFHGRSSLDLSGTYPEVYIDLEKLIKQGRVISIKNPDMTISQANGDLLPHNLNGGEQCVGLGGTIFPRGEDYFVKILEGARLKEGGGGYDGVREGDVMNSVKKIAEEPVAVSPSSSEPEGKNGKAKKGKKIISIAPPKTAQTKRDYYYPPGTFSEILTGGGDLNNDIMRGEAIAFVSVDEKNNDSEIATTWSWHRIDSRTGSGKNRSLSNQDQRIKPPRSVTSTTPLILRGDYFVGVFDKNRIPLDGKVELDLTTKLNTNSLPKPTSTTNNNREGEIWRFGVSGDVRNLWLQTMDERFPKSEEDLMGEMTKAGLGGKSTSTKRPKLRTMDQEENEKGGGKKRRRSYVKKNQRITNTHLLGTNLGADLARTATSGETF